MKLIDKIELVRSHMLKSEAENGMHHPVTYELSVWLDELLNQYEMEKQA